MDFTRPKTLLLSPLIALAASFAVLLIAFLFLSGSSSMGTYGANKTIGWAWGIMNDIAALSAIASVLLYVAGYAILWILRMQVNKTVSIINLCFLLALPVVWAVERVDYAYVFTLLTASCIALFLMVNIVFSVKLKAGTKAGTF
jgi:hypothetical protein